MAAEDYLWENIPRQNLSLNNVIDRKKFDFDCIYILMEQYAKEKAVEFLKWYEGENVNADTNGELYDQFNPFPETQGS